MPRSVGYMVAAGLLVVATVLYCVGFSTTYWIVLSGVVKIHTVHEGIWTICGTGEEYLFSTSSDCVTFSYEYTNDYLYFYWWRTCFALSLMGLLAASGLALTFTLLRTFTYTNMDVWREFARLPESVAYVAGMLGCLGCWVYATRSVYFIETKEDLRKLGRPFPLDVRVDWSFYLTLVATFLSVIAAVLLAVFNDLQSNNVNDPTVGQGQALAVSNIRQPQARAGVGMNPQSQAYVHVSPQPYAQQQIYNQPCGQQWMHNQPYGQHNMSPQPYGQQRMSPQPYGQPQMSPQPYGQQQMSPQPNGQPQMSPQPYDQQQMSPPPYGQQQMSPSPYGQQQMSPSPYGQPQMSPQPYGQPQMSPPPYDQQQMSPPPNGQQQMSTPPYAQQQMSPPPNGQHYSQPQAGNQPSDVGYDHYV
ncbi:basic salivary proline-rich protein 4-like [Littorina saxatilis]|uniref:Uncharacterized protein n=1 Tax=Littorina saxatilis TaxID=31220 RepID=A0AAN9AY40_9CAEN